MILNCIFCIINCCIYYVCNNLVALLKFVQYVRIKKYLFILLMHADDTTLFCCLEDIESDNKELVLNNELQRVHSWLNANRLSLNVKKTKYMLFRKHKSTEIR